MIAYVIFALFSFLLVGVGVFVLFGGSKGKQKKNASGKYSKRNDTLAMYNMLYKNLNSIFLTRTGLRKVYERLAELSIYGPEDTKIMAVRFYLVSTLASIAVVVVGAFTFKEVFSTILCVAFAYVVKTTVVDKQLDGIHFKLLKQLAVAISSLRQNYLRYNSIPDAVAETAVGPLIKRSFEEIYLILTSNNDEIRLEEFYASTPFKLLQTLAGVCFKINSSGDVKLFDGTSNFIQAMSMMSSEINLEIRRITLQRARFGILEILPLAPLLAVGIIEKFFSGVIPGTSIVYHGAMGYITKILIILSAMAGYTVIVKINSAVTIKADDRSDWVKRLLAKPKFKQFIQDIVPRKVKKISRKTRIIRNALSRCDIYHLYTKKVVFASAALVISLIAAIFIVNLSKDFTYKNIAELSLIGGENLSGKDIEIRKQMDAEYLSGKELNERKTAEFVEKHLPKMQEYDKQAQVKRLRMKYEIYYSTYFKWWMLLICYLIALCAWFAPEFILLARKWFIKTEAEEDVLQLQTMIAILMNTTCDTLDILYWLERQSRVHKHALLEAYHEYPSNPELSLNRLKAKGSLIEFKRMIEKLILTIHQISIAEAFGDLITERDHILRIREIAQVSAINKKRQAVSPLSMIPLGITALGYILLPLGILGFQEFSKAMSQMGFK
jgi:hypothetical protein